MSLETIWQRAEQQRLERDRVRQGIRAAVATALAVAALSAALFWPLFAIAQEVAPVAGEPHGLELASKLFDAVARGDWWMVAGVGVAFVVWLLRNTFRSRLPAGLMAVLDKPVVAFLVPVVVALAGGFSTAAMAGPITGPIAIAVVLGALKTSMASAFSFLFGANLKEQTELLQQKAAAAGAAAGAEVKTLDDAAKTLGKGPPQ